MISRMLQEAFEGGRQEPLVRASLEAGAEPRRTRLPRTLAQTPDAPILPGPEVRENEGDVSVTFDLGDATIAGVQTNLLGRLLYVDVQGPRPMRRVVPLPSDVEPEVRWTAHNGVLDLVLSRIRRPTAPP